MTTTNFARLRHNEQRFGLSAKWLLVAIGVAVLLLEPVPLQPLVVAAYAAVALAATIYFSGRGGGGLRSIWPYWISQLVDVLYVTALIALGEGLASPLYLLYPLLALKSLVYTPDAPGLVWLPFTYGPLYVLALWAAHGSLAFLADPLFLTRYLLLLILTVGIAVATWALAGRLREVDRLQVALSARTEDLASQTRTLQRTATDLGDRVLELRALQEVAKALSATLYIDDTLRTIVERLSRLEGSPYCAVALLDGERRFVSTLVATGEAPISVPLPLPLAGSPALRESLYGGRSQVWTETANPRDSAGTASLFAAWPGKAVEITPMMARGQPIGALLVGLDGPAQEDRRQRSLTESFAYFAATAVENARLYGDVAEKRRELEAVLAGIGDGVLVADMAGRLVLMNPVAARAFALEAPGVGAPLRSILPQTDLVELMEETAATGRVAIRELPIPSAGLSSDGQPRTFQALAAPVDRAPETDGQVGGVVAVLRDVTGQKELERMKSNFLSVVSHELKTPLHSIKGFVDIILMGKTGPVTDLQRDFLGTVQEQTGHLQRLIEDLLEFSRLESGQIRLRPVRVAPGDLAGTVVEKLSPLASNRHLELHLRMPADFPEVEADPMRLEQVLTNLVENAIKFTPEGGRICVQGWDRGQEVELAVSDTGIGIPPEERAKVFDRFYQVDSSARRRYKGTGLGLTICRHIVTQHGGEIWIQDAPESGSEFHFTLPKVFAELPDGEVALDFGVLAR
jgi:signal transduction histidine kinase